MKTAVPRKSRCLRRSKFPLYPALEQSHAYSSVPFAWRARYPPPVVFSGGLFRPHLSGGFPNLVNFQRSGGIRPVTDIAESGGKAWDIIGPDVIVIALNLLPVRRLVINVVPESIRRIRIVNNPQGSFAGRVHQIG